MNYRAFNATTGEPLPENYADATVDEINHVAAGAAAAADAFASVDSAKRGAFLDAIADELVARSQQLIERAHLETGLPVARLENERNRTVAQLRMFADLIREGSWVDARIDLAQPDRKPLPRPDLRRMLRAIGPVAVFGASNFPFAYSVAGGDTASALAAGNPVVVKAHPAHPGVSDLTAAAVQTAAEKTQMPSGVFGMVHGSSPDVSIALVRHPAIAAVGFTGSTRAGRALFDAAAARPKPIPVFAEMSSLNPLILLPAALEQRTESIAEGFVNSATQGMGQFCTKPGLVFGMAGPAWNRFGTLVAEKVSTFVPSVMLHSGIQASYNKGVAALNDIEWIGRGAAHIGRVDAATFRKRPELAHEIFGPFSLLITVRDQSELMSLLEDLDGQLTASVHGTSEELAASASLVALLTRKAGRLVCNGFPTGVEVAPAMTHGGPYPATTDARFTAVGSAAIYRFVRPISYQAFPEPALPTALRDANPLNLLRLVNGKLTRDPIASSS